MSEKQPSETKPTNQTCAIIMAGGIGERFWPLSQPNKPKQFLPFGTNNNTLIQDALERATQIAPLENIYIATSKELKPIFETIGLLPPSQILAEPCRRNTAGCLSFVLANLLAKQQDLTDITMAVLTADQRIEPLENFVKVANVIIQYVATHDVLGIIGIPPTRPETGFGYIEAIHEQKININDINIYPLKKFHEKPKETVAKSYIKSKNFYWNSGMFFWNVKTFLNELHKASPIHWDSIIQMKNAVINNDSEKVEAVFNNLPDISIDYALMEKTNNVVVAEAIFQWDDLGSWTSLERVLPKDENGNILHGNSVCLKSNNSIIYNDDTIPITITTLGIENLVVAVSNGVVLIMNKNEAQNLKQLLEKFKQSKKNNEQ